MKGVINICLNSKPAAVSAGFQLWLKVYCQTHYLCKIMKASTFPKDAITCLGIHQYSRLYGNIEKDNATNLPMETNLPSFILA